MHLGAFHYNWYNLLREPNDLPLLNSIAVDKEPAQDEYSNSGTVHSGGEQRLYSSDEVVCL